MSDKAQENPDELWTVEQITLQRWLALPKQERKPKTIALFAQQVGVDEATIYRWKKASGFADAVRQIIKEQLKDDLADVYASLRREARAGSYQHIKLVLELAGDYVERQEITGKMELEYVNDWRDA